MARWLDLPPWLTKGAFFLAYFSVGGRRGLSLVYAAPAKSPNLGLQIVTFSINYGLSCFPCPQTRAMEHGSPAVSAGREAAPSGEHVGLATERSVRHV